jgi:hypothetical protein
VKAFREHTGIIISLILRIFGDVRQGLKKEFLTIVFCSISSIIAQIAGFITALRYASTLQRKDHVGFFDSLSLTLSPQEEAVTIALLVGSLLLLSTFLGYTSRTMSAVIAARYEKFCYFRIVNLLSVNDVSLARPYNFPEINAIAHANSKICGGGLRSLCSGIFPIFMFAASISVAFFISPGTTLALLLLVLCSIPIIYLNSKKGLSAAVKLLDISGDANRDKQAFLDRSLSSHNFSPVYQSLPNFDLALKAYEDRAKSVEKSRSTIQSFIALSFIFVILYVGMSVDAGELNFGYILGYFLALRFSMNGLVALLSMVSGFSLSSVKIREYLQLVDSFTDEMKLKFPHSPAQYPIAFVTEEPAPQLELAYFNAFLASSGNYIYLDSVEIADINNWLTDSDDDAKACFRSWVDDFDRTLFDQNWNDISGPQKYVLKAAFAKASAVNSIYVSHTNLTMLPDVERHYVKTFINKTNTLYIYHHESFKTLKHGENHIIWFDKNMTQHCSKQEYESDKIYWNQVIQDNAGRKPQVEIMEEEDDFL